MLIFNELFLLLHNDPIAPANIGQLHSHALARGDKLPNAVKSLKAAGKYRPAIDVLIKLHSHADAVFAQKAYLAVNQLVELLPVFVTVD